MKMVQHSMAMWCGLVLFLVTLAAGYLTAKELRSDNDKYLCSEQTPGVCATPVRRAGLLPRPVWRTSSAPAILLRSRQAFLTLKQMRRSA
jgi:hypothetical protein